MGILKFNSAVEEALIAFGFGCKQVNFSVQSRFVRDPLIWSEEAFISVTIFYTYKDLDTNFTISVPSSEEGIQTSIFVRVMAELEAIRTKWSMDHEGESDSPRDILDYV